MRGNSITGTSIQVPALIAAADDSAADHFVKFLALQIPNADTRYNYAGQIHGFCAWCKQQGLCDIRQAGEVHVLAFREAQLRAGKKPSSLNHTLAALRTLSDWLMIRKVLNGRPASSASDPKPKGLPPRDRNEGILAFFETSPNDSLVDRRDLAIIAVMAYTFARIGSVIRLDVADYDRRGSDRHLSFSGKRGTIGSVIVHRDLAKYLDGYIETAGINDGPLFRAAHRKSGCLSANRLTQICVYEMLQRRARIAGTMARPSNKSLSYDVVASPILSRSG